MISRNLDNLVSAGLLKKEPPDKAEFEGLLASARARLTDARKDQNSPESQFDLAYNAAHAASLAALRWHGYRPSKRYIVFSALEHTLGLPAATWRILDKAHRERNSVEYEGYFNIDGQLLADLKAATQTVIEAAGKLGPLR